nr:MAG TPA: hypothetical protein [Bacteriophage sp.]
MVIASRIFLRLKEMAPRRLCRNMGIRYTW